METTKTKKRLLALGKGLLVLAVVMSVLWCFLYFVLGMLQTAFSFPFFVLIPGLILTRLVFLFRSRRSVGAKVCLLIVWILLLLFVLYLGMFSEYQIHHSSRRDPWNKFVSSIPTYCEKYEALGTPELGTPEEMIYHHYKTYAIWDSDANILLCRYSPTDYAAQKAALEQQYPFRTEPLVGDYGSHGEEDLMIEPYAKIGDDEFRFLYPLDGMNEYIQEYFRSSLLLVTNDAAREIGFISFDDIDLDMAKDLTRFLKKYCGWSVIR